MNKLLDDPRPIVSISGGEGEYQWDIRVGRARVDKILVVREPGQCGHVPWFEIYKGCEITRRISGIFVQSVVYNDAHNPFS